MHGAHGGAVLQAGPTQFLATCRVTRWTCTTCTGTAWCSTTTARMWIRCLDAHNMDALFMICSCMSTAHTAARGTGASPYAAQISRSTSRRSQCCSCAAVQYAPRKSVLGRANHRQSRHLAAALPRQQALQRRHAGLLALHARKLPTLQIIPRLPSRMIVLWIEEMQFCS